MEHNGYFYMTVAEFIEQLEGEQRLLMLALHEWLLDFPGMTSKIRYKIPFYDRRHWICYLNPLRDGGVEFCFIRADELSNANELLDFKNRTQIASVTLRSTDTLPEAALLETLQEALLLDETTPYTAPKTRRKRGG
jgi:Domain of unknown function (DU1801)